MKHNKQIQFIGLIGICLIFNGFPSNARNESKIKKLIPAGAYILPSADTIHLHGKIINENGVPLSGATVRIKASDKGSTTDANGDFNLLGIKNNAILIVSNIGYQTIEKRLNGINEITIILKKDINQLGLVTVSTGYQEIPKERATGSFDFIDNNTLNQQVGSNIIDRINGVTNAVLFLPKGMRTSGAPQLMIRGLSTINGNKNPLIVVDNFPYEGDINDINPDDVESITILKDAAATSIWGARAGNGVIVITTKKGRLNQPLTINVNADIMMTTKPDLSSLRILPSNDYINLEEELFNRGYYDSYLDNTYSYPALSPVVEILNEERDGTISAASANTQIDKYRNIDIRNGYNKYMYQTAASQRYSVHLSGGSHNISYFLSGGYDHQIDNLAGKAGRYTFISKNTYLPVKNLQLSVGVHYTQSDNLSGKPGYGAITNGRWAIPYLSFADPAGNPLPVAFRYRQAFTDTAGGGKLLDWNYYPLTDWKHNTTSVQVRDLSLDLGLNYQIAEGLNIDLKYLYERQTTEQRNLEDEQSYAARDLINSFSQIDPNTGLVTYMVPLGGILNLSQSSLTASDARGQLNYNRTWGRHNVVAIAGAEVRQAHTVGNGDVVYGYDNNTLTSAAVDLTNAYPSYINGNYNYIPGGVSLTDRLQRFVSYYANAAYTYNGRYVFSLSGRRDASNLFGVAFNNKWNPLWSAGFAWNASKEPFYHIAWLPYLKLRATYGFSGNTDPSRTGITTLVINSPIPPSSLPSSRVNQFPNPDLRWEKVKMINVGIDFQTDNQVISGTVEGYIKKGLDLFGSAPFDPTDGLNGQQYLVRNVANMGGQGIDVTLHSRNFNRKFKWHTTLQFSDNTSKTTHYYVDSSLRSNSFITSGSLISPLVGKPLYSIVAFRWAGLDQNGNPQGYNGKSVSTDYNALVNNTPKQDLVYKPSVPVIFGSLMNTWQWKGFMLTADITYRLGYYFMKPSVSYTGLFGNGDMVGSSDYLKRWQNPGDERKTNVPSMVYPASYYRDEFYTYSAALLERADNVKLQYVNLGYNLHVARWKARGVQSLQIYFNASNLGILWRANKDGIDPDYFSSTLPPGKSFAIGVRATL